MIDGIFIEQGRGKYTKSGVLIDINTQNRFSITVDNSPTLAAKFGEIYHGVFFFPGTLSDQGSANFSLEQEEAVSFWEQLATRVTSNKTKNEMLKMLKEA